MPTLAEIVARFGGEKVGADGTACRRLAPLGEAQPGDLSFLSNPRLRPLLASTRASIVITAPPAPACTAALILTADPYLYYARVAQWLHPPAAVEAGVHRSAVVEGEVDPAAQVGAHAYVGPAARVAAGAVLGPGARLLDGSSVGVGTRLGPNVTVYPGCHLGARCLVHAGAVIGGDGFGFARGEGGAWVKIPQVGGVRIGDDVEIGACTSIDRGALADTVIEDGVKLDNQIQIAHNVRIGAHSAIAGCVGIAGSTSIGQRCTIGGAAMIIGHLSIADDVHVAAGTFIAKSISARGAYTGTVPSMEHDKWLRNFAHLRHLDALSGRIKELERRLAAKENDA